MSDFARRGALGAIARGWRVFPLFAQRKRPPRGVSWQRLATNDAALVTERWKRAVTGYGIACGPSGLVVLDSDVPKPGEREIPEAWATRGCSDGEHVLQTYLADSGRQLPETLTVATPSGGVHRYFSAPSGLHVGNRVDWPCPLVDVRGVGGYVCGPGSFVNGLTYVVTLMSPVAPLPPWLAEVLTSPREAPGKGEPGRGLGSVRITAPAGGVVGHQWIDAAQSRELAKLTTHPAVQGGRNHLLNSVAYTLGRLVGAGLLDRATVESALLEATYHWWGIGTPPFTERESRATIKSGLDAGERNPRLPQPRERRRYP